MKAIPKIRAKVKGNGSIIKDKLADVFIKIGIAEKIEDVVAPKKAVVKKKK